MTDPRAPGQAQTRPTADGSTQGHAAFAIEYQITVVDGDQGERLAGLQAAAVLGVLAWLSRHASRDDPPTGAPGSPAGHTPKP